MHCTDGSQELRRSSGKYSNGDLSRKLKPIAARAQRSRHCIRHDFSPTPSLTAHHFPASEIGILLLGILDIAGVRSDVESDHARSGGQIKFTSRTRQEAKPAVRIILFRHPHALTLGPGGKIPIGRPSKKPTALRLFCHALAAALTLPLLRSVTLRCSAV